MWCSLCHRANLFQVLCLPARPPRVPTPRGARGESTRWIKVLNIVIKLAVGHWNPFRCKFMIYFLIRLIHRRYKPSNKWNFTIKIWNHYKYFCLFIEFSLSAGRQALLVSARTCRGRFRCELTGRHAWYPFGCGVLGWNIPGQGVKITCRVSIRFWFTGILMYRSMRLPWKNNIQYDLLFMSINLDRRTFSLVNVCLLPAQKTKHLLHFL